MANTSIDLNKLKDEIHNRKTGKNIPSSRFGEGTGAAPRDTFLNGLMESLHTGRETPASALVKTVENKVVEKKGGGAKLPIRESTPNPQHQNQTHGNRINEIDMSPDREEQLYRDFENMNKKTLAESIEGYTKMPQVGSPMQNTQYVPQQGLNEGYLVENVKKIVNNYLVENFGAIVEESIRSTIIEMYAVERIKEVLHENKDLIKTVVVETIREIQAKSKPKAH